MDARAKTIGHDWDLKQQFEHLGFNEVTAKYLAEILEANPLSNHQSAEYWASSYIDHLFQSHILLTGRIKQPTNQDETREFIYTDPNANQDMNDGDNEVREPVKIKTRNILGTTDTDSDAVRKYKSQNFSSVQDVEFWFHGTDHESAFNIAKHGIELSKGKRGADFSNGSGFYVTPEYDFAEQWPGKYKRESQAVIVFKNNKEILSGGKEFSRVDEKWKDMVKWYRNRKDVKDSGISRYKGKEFDKFKYIFGPMTADFNSALTNPTQRGNKVQLCLKEDNLAEDFYNYGKNIEEIIFFND